MNPQASENKFKRLQRRNLFLNQWFYYQANCSNLTHRKHAIDLAASLPLQQEDCMLGFVWWKKSIGCVRLFSVLARERKTPRRIMSTMSKWELTHGAKNTITH